MEIYDLICIGAGPTGLACAIEAVRAGLNPVVIDKGAICNSIYHYPVNMVFFTTPELLEIGDLPLVSPAEKPARIEALKYYRKAAEHYGLTVRLYELVTRLDGQDGHFIVSTRTEKGTERSYRAAKVVVATGYYDLPNELGVPGEDLPHVSHYYTEPHEFWNQNVVVVGGKNSAAEAALDLWRNGARFNDQVLGTSRYSKPHRGRTNSNALELESERDHSRRRGDRKRSRAAASACKTSVPADGLSSGFRFH